MKYEKALARVQGALEPGEETIYSCWAQAEILQNQIGGGTTGALAITRLRVLYAGDFAGDLAWAILHVATFRTVGPKIGHTPAFTIHDKALVANAFTVRTSEINTYIIQLLGQLIAEQGESTPAVDDRIPLPPPVAAAGWYPDPAGAAGQRYWNGSAWTEQTA